MSPFMHYPAVPGTADTGEPTKARNDIRPCPFCGGGTNLKDFRHGPLGDDCFIQCIDCTSCGPSGKTPELAVEAWNRRALKVKPSSEPPPFANCRFKACDLPGQCVSEGKCHHPQASEPPSVVAAAREVLRLNDAMDNKAICDTRDDAALTAWNKEFDQLEDDMRAALEALRAALQTPSQESQRKLTPEQRGELRQLEWLLDEANARALREQQKYLALCLALKTHAGDTDGYEFGLVRVKFDAHGQVASCLWASQDEIDAAIRAALTTAAPEVDARQPSGATDLEMELYQQRASAQSARRALWAIVDAYDCRSDLFTNDADCAANLADRARAALEAQSQPLEPRKLTDELHNAFDNFRDGQIDMDEAFAVVERIIAARLEGQSIAAPDALDGPRFRWLLANMWCRHEGEFRYWQTKLFKDGIPLSKAIDAAIKAEHTPPTPPSEP